MMWLLSAIAFIPVVFLLLTLTLTSIIWSAEEPTEEPAGAEVQGVGDGAFDDSEYDDEYGLDDWEDGSVGEDDDADEADLADAVQQLAEMAMLGYQSFGSLFGARPPKWRFALFTAAFKSYINVQKLHQRSKATSTFKSYINVQKLHQLFIDWPEEKIQINQSAKIAFHGFRV
ncbi:hypothetical protein VOLCADRAFT_87254 [Volvox carteri f. nagariensis]|uniref:Uncharacterized protein n=1 Tax=Volvox carteri f. nagariensis TaxID=3068 RepID=D8TKJ8_VOLCA|nr:uncharacterized protein VOLCADRAFT_87254 [Volvox carteri f. nagariensis]EFJ52074.1 hypothetical protein VOLCADRAFT_87254 [Volvox carteri f. nagariensis]|eukprot:XP_002946848.1 hypothetical protein VOLCADRAFT_87254 [Volvox carteri f. nagariensis]